MATFTTHEPQEATYSPVDLDNLRLTPRSSSSYTANDLYSLESFLIQRRYAPVPTRSGLEMYRYRKGDRLIVAYLSCSVVLQGDDVAGARTELQRFVVEVQA